MRVSKFSGQSHRAIRGSTRPGITNESTMTQASSDPIPNMKMWFENWWIALTKRETRKPPPVQSSPSTTAGKTKDSWGQLTMTEPERRCHMTRRMMKRTQLLRR